MSDSENQEPGGADSPAEGFAGILAERREKLDRLRAAGVDPFPHSFPQREEIASVLDAHQGLEAGAETDSVHRIAGRIAGRRGHGKAAFIDLRDASGQIQIHAKADVLGDQYGLLEDLDLGDFIGIEDVYKRQLRTPVGPIHWAGAETATRWAGYMDGAITSGIRAATEIANGKG